MCGLQLNTNGEKDLDDSKRLKIQLPVRQHLQLRRIKILTEQNLSETVEEALDLYFDHIDTDEEAS